MNVLTLDRPGVVIQTSAEPSVHKFSPLSDPRWKNLLARHKDASVFHTPGWLAALKRSYGYEPIGFTTSDGQSLENGIIFCDVKSWLTGRRLVSLPFSDHCQPLGSSEDIGRILTHVHSVRVASAQRHLEVRPLTDEAIFANLTSLEPTERFKMHRIDLRSPLDVLFRQMHESCIRRKIKRAEREELTYTVGRSKEMIDIFYNLLLLTRRKHQLPPQPRSWFENLAEALQTGMTIHVASNGQTPVASIITLEHKETIVYKYGCSDDRHSSLGGTPFLFWKVIQQAKQSGLTSLDLGRSDIEEPGLSTFKERLGGTASELCYFRDVPAIKDKHQSRSSIASWSRKRLAHMPDPILIAFGQALYRHMG